MKKKLKVIILSLVGFLTKLINGPHVTSLIVNTKNGIFSIDVEDVGVGLDLRKNGKYGDDEIQRLKPSIMPESKILIVGGHVGTLAIPLSKICKEVVAIEANPQTFETLQTNILLNNVTNCRAINIAASDKEEQIQFLLNRYNSGGSKRVPKNKEYIYYYDRPEEVSVNAYSLDQYLGTDNEFDVIVMDIEGSEYFALAGMQQILAKASLLSIEFVPHHLKNVSGASVQQLLSLIEPHFSKLTIPTKKITIVKQDFLKVLSEMYEQEEKDDGIIFKKN